MLWGCYKELVPVEFGLYLKLQVLVKVTQQQYIVVLFHVWRITSHWNTRVFLLRTLTCVTNQCSLCAGDTDSAEDNIWPHHQLPDDPWQHVPCLQGRAGSADELRELKDVQWRSRTFTDRHSVVALAVYRIRLARVLYTQSWHWLCTESDWLVSCTLGRGTGCVQNQTGSCLVHSVVALAVNRIRLARVLYTRSWHWLCTESDWLVSCTLGRGTGCVQNQTGSCLVHSVVALAVYRIRLAHVLYTPFHRKIANITSNVYIHYTVGWTWWDWSLILSSLSSFSALMLPVGHLICKNLFSIWSIMCLVGH